MKSAESTLSQLEFPEYFRNFNANQVQSSCKDLFSPLLALYDPRPDGLPGSREQIANRPRELWRWEEFLSVCYASYRLTQGEGDMLLIQAPRNGRKFDLKQVHFRNEATNPIGTSKAFGLAEVVSHVVEFGCRSFIVLTAGNAGAASAFYASHSCTKAYVLIPEGTSPVVQDESRVSGADLHLVYGSHQ